MPESTVNWLMQIGQYRTVGETLTDADAIEASERDPRCFALIFDRHFRAINRYLRRRLERGLADDLAAETFAVAFARRSAYDPRQTDARPWLFGIAANLLRHQRRSERRQLLAYGRTGVDSLVDGAFEAVDARVDAQAMGPRLAVALASLPWRDRETLLLYAWAGLTYEEISDALAIPVGTVRSRLSRARTRLRELLGAFGQFQGEQVPLEGGSNG